MRSICACWRVLVLALGLLAAPAAAAPVHVVPIAGPIGPATSDFVVRAIGDAARAGAALVVLRIDTPGGLDSAMRVIVQAILEAPLPVVAHVAPPGARAASAGTFILYASHLAAMAPGTNLGAATPVPVGGDAPAPRSAGATKAVEDAAAYLRGLAELRGRDPRFAEAAVREARSLTATAALAAGVIDLVAGDLDELLRRIDGRTVTLERGPVTLATADARPVAIEPDWRYRLLAIITDPSVTAILMLIGVYGIIIEFYSPGLVGPGLVGAICLLLGLYALQVLPVSYAGVALLGLGLALVVAEAFVPSFGILGIAGTIAVIGGAILLVDTDVPGLGARPWLVGSVAALASGLFVVALGLAVRGRNRPVLTGGEAIAHGHGRVVDWQGGHGHVRLAGEIWAAQGPSDLAPDTIVTVTKRDGLVLVVTPAPQPD